MWGLEGCNQETPAFNRHIGKSVIDRLNMGRLFVFNLFAGAVVILMTACFSALNIYILDESIQARSFILFAVCLLLSAFTVFITARNQQEFLFSKVCIGYIAMFSLVMLFFAFCSVSTAASILFYWMLMSVIGLLPILPIKTFSVIWLCEAAVAIILAINRRLSPEGIISLMAIGVMSFVLSYITYSHNVRKLNYRVSLNNALSQAETDPMTKLLNRRGLDRRIENIWPHCVRQHVTVAVLMIDIDNFKKYNDTFGHAEGDECIKSVSAAILKAVKRRTDYAARVGGEEFLVFLTSIDAKSAVKWALDLKKDIDDLKIPHSSSNFNPYVSVSMGLSCSMVQADLTFEKLRDDADKSLYDAKENGRACLYYNHKAFGKASVFRAPKAGNE